MPTIYFLIAITLLQPNISSAEIPKDYLRLAANLKFESTIKIKKHRRSVTIEYMASGKTNIPTKRRSIIKVPSDITESQFFDAEPLSIFNDSLPAVEITGNCGNKVCEKLVFRFNESLLNYHLFFRGAYSSISMFEDYLIEAGSSGCCSFEYHAYRLPKPGLPISAPPEISISITNTSDSTGRDIVNCSFTNAAGENITPPNRNWLAFCGIYGESYQLRN